MQPLGLSGGAGGDDPDDLCHTFLLFLLDEWLTAATRNPDMIQLLLTGQFQRTLELAWGRFVWRAQDADRNKQTNPRGYLYRRLRETLKTNREYEVIDDTNGKLYYRPVSTVHGQTDPVVIGHLLPLTFSDWPSPPPQPGKAPEKYLFSSDWLAEAAGFFWREAQRRLDHLPALPIRELCRYLAEQHSWLNNPVRQTDDGDLTERLADSANTPEEDLQQRQALDSIEPLAQQLVLTWSLEQRQVFALHLADPPLTFKAISERLGQADHNRAYAVFQKVKKSLVTFTSSWPGPPLSELPVEIAEIFLEEMKRLCKNSLN
jgi:hypothetical protein